MYTTLLGALLVGLFPVVGGAHRDAGVLAGITVSPPALEVDIAEHVSASGVVVMDLLSGQNLYARDARVPRPMASLTKLMTAVIIVESHDLGELVRIPEDISDTPGNVAYLPPGQTFTVGDLLSALLVTSANDAAKTLARYHSGSASAFVDTMNARAASLGLKSTSFRNPEGLDHPEHRSSPQDFAWLTAHAEKYPAIIERMGLRHTQIVSREGQRIPLSHTHALLHEEGVIAGGKTGTTNDAGQCLISLVDDGDRKLVVVLLNSRQRYQDTRVILGALGVVLGKGSGSTVESVAILPRP